MGQLVNTIDYASISSGVSAVASPFVVDLMPLAYLSIGFSLGGLFAYFIIISVTKSLKSFFSRDDF